MNSPFRLRNAKRLDRAQRHGVAVLVFLYVPVVQLASHLTFINFFHRSPPSRQPAIRRRVNVEDPGGGIPEDVWKKFVEKLDRDPTTETALAQLRDFLEEKLIVRKDTTKGELGQTICLMAQQGDPIPTLVAKGIAATKNAVGGILLAESFYNSKTEEAKEFWVHSSLEIDPDAWYHHALDFDLDNDTFPGKAESVVLRLEPQDESKETTEDEMVMKVSDSNSSVLLGRAIASKLQEYKKIQLSLVLRSLPVVMKSLPEAEILLKDELPEGEKTKIIFHPFCQKLATDRFEDGFRMMMDLIRA